MSEKILHWHDVDLDILQELYLNFPYPPYFGSPLVDDRLQNYRFQKICKDADASPDSILVGMANGIIYCAAQLQRVDYLSDHFGIEVANITNEAFICDASVDSYLSSLLLIRRLRDQAEQKGFVFLTSSVASPAKYWIHALEEADFRYSDGFYHAIENMEDDYNQFLLNNLVIRDPIDLDYKEIIYSYNNVPFPSHLLYEPEFDKKRIVDLYVKRYREVAKGLGRVFVAELNGQFAGCLNGIIDKTIQRELDVKVNALSQGMITHPRSARKGVALALIAYRHNWYREMGVKYGFLGSNINNVSMIRGLIKMNMKFAVVEYNFTLRL